MRKLCLLLLLLPMFACAQRDTIRISQLDQTLFFQPRIQSILFEGRVRPINFFYSNTFEFRRKPFTGVAIETHEGKRTTIELRDGKILHLEEFNVTLSTKEYIFVRFASNVLILRTPMSSS